MREEVLVAERRLAGQGHGSRRGLSLGEDHALGEDGPVREEDAASIVEAAVAERRAVRKGDRGCIQVPGGVQRREDSRRDDAARDEG